MKPLNTCLTRLVRSRVVFAMAALVLVAPAARAGIQYGAGSFTWDNGSTAAWSATTGGPYTSTWTSGDDAVLEGAAGTVTISNPTVQNLTVNTNSYILSGGSTLTLSGSTPTLFLGSGITTTIGNNTATVLGGSVGLTKAGVGTLTLNPSAVSTFNGGLAVNGGTFAEDFSNLTSGYANLIDGGNALTLGGGTLSLKGKGSQITSQGFTSTTLNSGGSIITLTQNSATSLTAALGAITRNAGATLGFSVVPNTSTVIATTSTANEASGILGPWASVGATTSLQYGTVNGSGQIVSYGGATVTTQPASLSDVTNPAVNYAFGATPSPTQTGAISANTLRFTGAAGTLKNDGFTTTLNGLMNAGTGTLTVASAVTGNGQIVIGANKELVITANDKGTTINAQILDNPGGASSLVYNGAGSTLTLNYNPSSGVGNTYSGGTVINSGSVSTAANGYASTPFFGTGPVTINPGATLALNRTQVTNTVNLNNCTVTAGNSFGSTLSGSINLTGITTFNISGNLTLSGSMNGAGGLIKSGGAAVPVTGSNGYTGPTAISAGALKFMPQALYGGNSSLWTPANISVASGAIMGVFFGGASDFTATQVDTLLANLTTGVYNNGLKAGSAIAFDTTNGNGTYSGTITDSTGTGGGAIGLQKFGTNALTLSGNNTFTGPVFIAGGGTLKVSSLNYITSGTLSPNTSSSLGHPTTVANGSIACGAQNSNQPVTLVYLGTGETTDRVLVMNAGVNGTALTLDQSGTGLLKFTSNISTPSGGNNRILVLQGSTAGTGEIAGSITNVSATQYSAVTKQGTGTWTLSGTNTYQPVSGAGVTAVNGGCLVLGSAGALPGGIGATGGVSPLTFNGGVLGLGAGDFNRNLAAAGTATGVCFTGNGGWAAYGADRVVNLNNDSHQVVWATASTGLNGKTLILGNATATHTVDFQNPLDLGGATRTVQVDDGTAAIDGKLSGSLTNGNLTKTGNGTLALPGSMNYNGATTVSAGTLLVSGTNGGTSTVTVNSLATFGGTGSIGGGVNFNDGAKAVFTVTRDPDTELNTTSLTVTGAMAFNASTLAAVVHLNLPANLPSGTYTLATASSITVGGMGFDVPVLDSGSYAAGFSSAAITVEGGNTLVLTVNGLATTPTTLAIASVNGGANPTVGLGFNVVVQARDANGTSRKVVTDTAVTLSLTSGTGSLSGTLGGTIAAGTNSVTISGVIYNTAESGVVIHVAATSGDSLTAANSAPFTVIPDTTPTSLTVSGFPSPQLAGVPGSVTVTAKTPSGGTATSYAGTVHFTSSAVSAGLPSDYAFVPGDAGVHVFSGVTLNTAGLQSITATDTVTSSITGTQAGIDVVPAAAATLVVAGFPSPHGQGVPGSVTVTVKDAFGNTVTNYGGTIQFSSSDPGATLPSPYTFGGGDSGTHNFSNGVVLNTLGLQSITATDMSVPSVNGSQTGINVWIPPTIFTWATTSSGNWSDAANWTNDQSVVAAPAATGQADYTLNFGTGNYTATNNLGSGFLVNRLAFAGTVTIAGSQLNLTINPTTVAPPEINQNSGNAVTVTNPLQLDADVTVAGSGNGQVSLVSAIGGTGALTKNGSATGTLSLSAANSYGGGTTVNAGTLAAGSSGNSIFGTGAVTMNAGTTLALNGNGNLTNSIVLRSAKVTNGNGFSANLNGPVTLDGSCTLDLGGTGNMSVGGVISDEIGLTGGLTKIGNGGGPLYLNNANTYTGATHINFGSIALGASGSIDTTSSISLAAGTSFDVSAKVSPYVWSSATGLVAAGTGTTAGVTAARLVGKSGGEVDLGAAPSIQLTFSPLFTTGDVTHPALHISQGTLRLNNNAFTVNNAGPALGTGVYRLIQVGDGSTGVINENASPAYTVTVTGNGLAAGGTATVSVSSGNVIMTVVSDPYDPWIKTYFPTPGDPRAAKDADPDGDGSNNLEEFALDDNPNSGTASGKVRSRIVIVGSDNMLVLTIPVRGTASTPVFAPPFGGSPALTATSDHVIYTIEGSSDLTTFDRVVTEIPAETDMPVALDTGWSYRSFQLDGAVGGVNPSGFMRVVVESAP